MQKIKQIIDEIKQLKEEPTHKSALRIYTLLENNKKLFSEAIDANDLNYFLRGFETVSHKNPVEFNEPMNLEEYKKICENFLFHCNRIL